MKPLLDEGIDLDSYQTLSARSTLLVRHGEDIGNSSEGIDMRPFKLVLNMTLLDPVERMGMHLFDRFFDDDDEADEIVPKTKNSHFTLAATVILLLALGATISSSPTSRLLRLLRTITLCAIFMLVGPSLMILNKQIMDELKFSYPMALSCLGLAFSGLVIRIAVGLGLVGPIRKESAEVVSGSNWRLTVLPIALAKAITLGTGNAAYMHLGLGYIQMLKAFTPVIVLGVMWLADAPRPSRTAVAGVGVIVVGTLLEVSGALSGTLVGLLILFTSEFFEAVQLVLSQRLLQEQRFTVIEGIYFLAPAGATSLFILSLFVEGHGLFTIGVSIVAHNPSKFAAASFLGLVVNFLGLEVLKVTSSLTLKVLNLARCVGLVVVSIMFYGEIVSPLQAFGYFLCVVGFLGYNYAQLDETTREGIRGFFVLDLARRKELPRKEQT